MANKRRPNLTEFVLNRSDNILGKGEHFAIPTFPFSQMFSKAFHSGLETLVTC